MKKIILVCSFGLMLALILIIGGDSTHNQGRYVSAEEFRDKWPFTVSEGYVYSVNYNAIFNHNGTEYALNGSAKDKYRDKKIFGEILLK